MDNINRMVDFKFPQSHAPISKRGLGKQQNNMILPETVAGQPEFQNLPGDSQRLMVKKGGVAGMMSAERFFDGLENQIVRDLKPHVSLPVAQVLAKSIVGLVKGGFKLLFPKSGGITKKEVIDKGVKVGKNVGKVVLPIALDVGVNTGAQALSNAVLDPLGLAPVAPLVGKIVGKVARSQIKKKVGYGKKCDSNEPGVGVYGGKKKPVKKATSGTDKRRLRGQIIKKLMKEDGMSFVDASKSASKYMK